MRHRKSSHAGRVKPCNLYVKGKCLRSDDLCWFIHEKPTTEVITNLKDKVREKESHLGSQMDFQMFPKDHNPPQNQLEMVLKTLSNLCQKVQEIDTHIKGTKD